MSRGKKEKFRAWCTPFFLSLLGLDNIQRGEGQGQPDPRAALGRWFGVAIREAVKPSGR